AWRDPHAAAAPRRTYRTGTHERPRVQPRGRRRAPRERGRVMETSIVRNRLRDTIERAKRTAAERRAAAEAASRDYGAFLQEVAIPLFRQVAGALKAANYPFTVN